VSLGWGLLLLCSYGPLCDRLLSPFEDRYHAFGAADSLLALDRQVRYVTVLGGGHTSDYSLPPSGRLSASSAVRLLEGVRIQRALNGTKLLLSGGSIVDPRSNAEAMRDVALQLGVPDSVIMLQTAPTNTEGEVLSLKQHVGDAAMVVVTSASHMPRAIAMFEHFGLHPIPAPTDQLVKHRQQLDPSRLFPSVAGLQESERASYELFATIWAKITGAL
jgi:uncharacterized SAM-binding protein YcdF (DUF218 family)